MKSPKKENSLRFDVPASSGVNALFIFRFAFFTLLSLAFLKLFRSAIFDPWFLSSFALSLCAGISALGADLVPSRAGLVSDVLCFLSGAAAAALTLKFHPQLSLYLVIYCALVVFLSLARQIMHTRSAAA